jgi:hypothetical protein
MPRLHPLLLAPLLVGAVAACGTTAGASTPPPSVATNTQAAAATPIATPADDATTAAALPPGTLAISQLGITMHVPRGITYVSYEISASQGVQILNFCTPQWDKALQDPAVNAALGRTPASCADYPELSVEVSRTAPTDSVHTTADGIPAPVASTQVGNLYLTVAPLPDGGFITDTIGTLASSQRPLLAAMVEAAVAA